MTHRQTRIVIVTAAVLAACCSLMLLWALTRSPDPVAEPAPFTTTSAPATTTTTTSTTTAAPTSTTTVTTTTTTSRPAVKAPVSPPKTTVAPPAATPNDSVTLDGICKAGQWRPNTGYDKGAAVLHNGGEWVARQANSNDEPGADATWLRVFSC